MQQFIYKRSRTQPAKMKAGLLKMTRKQLGPDYDVDTHFTPAYNPWDQRLCLVPNADLFEAIKSGKARRGDRHDRHVHRRRHPHCAAARSWPPTSSSPPPGCSW